MRTLHTTTTAAAGHAANAERDADWNDPHPYPGWPRFPRYPSVLDAPPLVASLGTLDEQAREAAFREAGD